MTASPVRNASSNSERADWERPSVDLLQCVTWSFHTEDPADGRLHHAASPLNLKPQVDRSLSVATDKGVHAEQRSPRWSRG
jgi:hypothetical protein